MTPSISMNSLYNKKTLFSLSGSSVAVWLFTTVIASILNINIDYYKWVGLIVALFLSFVGAIEIKQKNFQQYTIIFFNGLLIYITACGIDSINHSTTSKKKQNKVTASIVPFTDSKIWWKPKSLVEGIDSLENNLYNAEGLNKEYANTLKYYQDSISNNGSLLIKIDSLYKQQKNLIDENNKLKLQIKDLSKSVEKEINKELNQSKSTVDLNFKINDYNISMLMQTLELSSNLNKKLNNFSSTGKYMPGVYSISYLQKDIFDFQVYLDTCVLEINYLLKNLKKE